MSIPGTTKHWRIRTPNPKLQQELSDALGIHPVIAQLLINRDVTAIEDARRFLHPDLSSVHDPFQLVDMKKAVARIMKAKDQGEIVLVFGDYDVDGVTSSAVLSRALHRLGIKVINHIPHRLNDGYGLNADAVRIAKEEGASLVITVDCGITALEEVGMINRAGLDVIVIDHHEPSSFGLPPALAVIDPKRGDCPYPFKHLAAVGLAAKLIHALFGQMPQDDLDLIALGTIADVVPLKGENRIFVKAGLPHLGRTRNKGLSALMEVAKIRGKEFRPYYAGFIIGPRLNAGGRMDTAKTALDLLMSDSSTEARTLAETLDASNAERQKLQRDVIQEADDMIERGDVHFKEQKVIVVSKEGWHKGVLGIVAARLVEKYYRPSIVISLDEEGIGTASARSVEGFHLHDALSRCGDVLETFGGHKLAAGLRIREENIERFRALMNGIARDTILARDLVPMVNIDFEMPLSGLDLELVGTINSLEPFGESNPDPVFCSRNLTVKGRPAVLGRDTIKFWVTDGRVSISAIGFGMGKYKSFFYPGQKLDLAYQVIIDDWNKAPTVQLKLKDFREN